MQAVDEFADLTDGTPPGRLDQVAIEPGRLWIVVRPRDLDMGDTSSADERLETYRGGQNHLVTRFHQTATECDEGLHVPATSYGQQKNSCHSGILPFLVLIRKAAFSKELIQTNVFRKPQYCYRLMRRE
jgi:hypothetical protein